MRPLLRKRWLWRLVAVLVLLGIVGVVLWMPPAPYREVRVGMTAQEVAQLFGNSGEPFPGAPPPPAAGGQSGPNSGLRVERRVTSQSTVIILYEDGRVMGKMRTTRVGKWFAWALRKVGLAPPPPPAIPPPAAALPADQFPGFLGGGTPMPVAKP